MTRKVLTDEQKAFIVTRLAMFDTLTDVSEAFYEEFGGDRLVSQHVAQYDPTRSAGAKLSKRWKTFFEEQRKEFKAGKLLPILAQKEARVSELEKTYRKAKAMKNYVLANQTLEQIAKEMGQAYTNKIRAEHSGPNGDPMQVAMTAVINISGMPGAMQIPVAPQNNPAAKEEKKPG
jgi:hypothetical protein